ncbi:hypothetical protein MKW98_032196 [Papaver atlanticum]|uniref:Pentatricopeptide repeat-containing protein n=1 Tax=Papaver atlanticum TaxID=357466 RepID=A0AAD4XEK7_9MAGN|nr:hypothetical protein MKW98_032196 [Papaver atlanticum]
MNTRNLSLMNRFTSMLQSCSCLRQCYQVHSQIIVHGMSDHNEMGSRILGMYVRCKSFSDAKNVFFGIDLGYASPWNWMIRGFTVMGSYNNALLFYFKMLGCGISPDKYTFPYVVKACSNLNSLGLGRLIHESVVSTGFEMDVFVGSSLIKLYAENGAICDAHELFEKLPVKDSVLWNVMINGYVKNGDLKKAMDVFTQMRYTEIMPNYVTFACVLSICASEMKLEMGRVLHGLAISCGVDSESPVANTLLAMYSKSGCLYEARKIFDMTPRTDLVTWNGMIAGYAQNGSLVEACDLFREMLSAGVKPDSITFSSFLPSVSDLGDLKQGKEIHGYIVRHGVVMDAFLKTALIDIYFKCREIEMACSIFNQTKTVDAVIYTAMISGFVLHGMHNDALRTFQRLLDAQMRPTSVTLASVLPALSGLASLRLGKELHGYILKYGHEKGGYVGSSLTDMYAKCGRMDLANSVFHRMPVRDVVAWNSMISSCSQNGKPEEAISLFRDMGLKGANYNCATISAALSACSNLPALHYGKEIHGFMMKGSFRTDLFAESALVDMYSKCGDLNLARRVFDLMEWKNEVSWNSIIAAYGTHGRVKEAQLLFHAMLEKGFQPDHITFLSMISACSHAGLIDEGIDYFRSMTENYEIRARMEHYACMVDLLGRAGRLDEALNIITSIPFEADAGIWGALLGASRNQGNVEIAEVASKHLFKLDPQNSGYYILMANVHADAGQWASALKVRELMKERGVKKLPGCSWIEINGVSHMFVAAYKNHPESAEIYLMLKNLLLDMKKEGYAPQPYLSEHPQIANV